MADEYQQQYNVEPAPSMPWKTIAIVIGATLLGVIIIIGAVMLVRSWQRNTQLVNMEDRVVETVMSQIDGSLEECGSMEDPEGCRNNLLVNEATTRKAAFVCEVLEGQEKYNCIELVAYENLEPNDCEAIDNSEISVDCKNKVTKAVMIEANDYIGCSEIKDLEIMGECQNYIQVQIIKDGTCIENSLDESLCDVEAGIQKAINAHDPSYCYELEESLLEGCLDRVGPTDLDLDNLELALENILGTSDLDTDSDNDQLGDWDEVNTYNTDPTNPDTDGDGYSDGTEVAGGYNPLGQGSL
jgi:hypothetical protein